MAAYVVAGCVWLLLLAGCESEPGEMVALGTLERDRVDLVADSNEPIVAMLAVEGLEVSEGDVLFRQDDRRARARLAGARAEEDAARAVLAQAEEGPRLQEIEQGRARLEAASSAANTAKHELERQISLVELQYASQNLVDILQGRYDEALAHEAGASAALDELLEGTRSEAIDQARSRFAAARAVLEDVELAYERATVTAPIAGRVDAVPFEVGERPPAGASVVVLLAAHPVYARVHIPHSLRVHLSTDSRAEVVIDGYAQAFAGRLRWVSADAAFTPYYALSRHDRGRLSYVAEVDLTDSDAVGLPIGVPVEVRFPEIQSE
ncbi:MAG: HlyD family efflux transporter periplasmic adaptor subunit [Pseudomonadales bacterium]|nr:HlyD family efflux transporter periplasmic adaptor subunit [Pseudomonadales bacterium]